jgi:fructose-bisphosphate aldolase class II
MKTLREYIAQAEDERRAIPHFNVANSDMLLTIFETARKVSVDHGDPIPIVVGVSEGERDAFGEGQFVDYVESLRNQHHYPIFSNADHTYSVERSKDAIDAGYDMVIYDGANISHEENIERTREVVNYRNEISPECIVEAEFGYIGAGSSIKDTIPDGVSEATKTKPDEAKEFVQKTGIDLLAPSVGNVHGVVKTGNPHLDPELVSEIRETAGVPLVLHGGSGSLDGDIEDVVRAGISMIHASTELRLAFRKGLEEALAENDTLAPYRYVKQAKANLGAVVEQKIRLFWVV